MSLWFQIGLSILNESDKLSQGQAVGMRQQENPHWGLGSKSQAVSRGMK